jgi:hypothetical protein
LQQRKNFGRCHNAPPVNDKEASDNSGFGLPE